MMQLWKLITVSLAAAAAACTGPALDLGASLRDADGADAGPPDAGRQDAGCRSDGDCTSPGYAHCAVDSGVCARCTEDSQCGIARCEIKANPVNNHCELEGDDDAP